MLWVPRANKGTQSARTSGGCRKPASHSGRARRLFARRALACAAVAALAQSAHAGTVNWIAGTDGLWHESYRWSSNPLLPGPADDVVIDRPGDLLVSITQNDQSINSLTCNERLSITGGSLSVAAASQVNGDFQLLGGWLGGTGSFTINGTGTWSNTTNMEVGGSTIISSTGSLSILSGYQKRLKRNLDNFGAVTVTADSSPTNVDLLDATIYNRAGATFTVNVSVDNTFYGGTGTNQFLNQGTFIKSGTATTSFEGDSPTVFVNNGLVNVLGGTLRLRTGAAHAGDFSIAVGANLRLEGSHTLASTSHLTGGGSIGFYSGTSVVEGSIAMSNLGVLTVSGSTLTANGTSAAGVLSVTGGSSVIFNGDASFVTTTLNGLASFSGSGQVTLTGAATWSGGGAMTGSGKTIIGPAGSLTLTPNGSAKSISRNIENRGIFNWNGAGATASLNLTDVAFSNIAGATFNINGDGDALNGAGGTNVFNNAGTIIKSGTGSASFSGVGGSIVSMNNTGTINMSAGTLSTASPLLNSGTVSLSGGTLALAAGLSNSGLIDVTGGVLNVSGTNTTAQWGPWRNMGGEVNVLGTFDNTAATLLLTADTGSLRMQSGSRLVGGTLATGGGARLQIVGPTTLDGISTSGSVTLRADAAATILNGLTLGGALSIDSDVPVTMLLSGSQTIGGAGQIVPTGSAGAALTITASSGSTLTLGPNVLARPGDHDLLIGSTNSAVIAQGTITANLPSRTLTLAGTSVQNQGVFDASNGGTLFVSGALANISAGTLSGGRWTIGDNSAILAQGADITTLATSLTLDGPAANFYRDGSGTISALANLAQNAATGEFCILNGRTFSTVGDFANAGRLTIGPASAWATAGVFTNSGTVVASGPIASSKTINDGLITQNGGTHSASGDLVIGNSLAGARWDLNAGAINVGGFATVGSGTASATMNQNDGDVTVARQLYVGVGGPNNSAYNLAGGSLTAPELYVGFFSGAQGTFNQTGGVVTLTGTNSSSTTAPLTIGYSSLATTKGVYTLSGGTLANNGVDVGFGAGGSQFVQSGGTHTISGALGLKLAMFPGGNGAYSLGPDGTLTVAADEQIGVQGAGVFTQTGGIHNVAGAITLGVGASSTGTFNLSGGTLNASLISLLRGTFNQTGGTLNAASFIHNGGEVAGALQNQGVYTYSSGPFSGRLINSGTVILNANLTLGNGLDNRAGFTVPAGRTVAANGLGISNSGAIAVSGGTLNAAAMINNGVYQQVGTASLGNISGTGATAVDSGSLAAGFIRQDALSIQNDALVSVATGAGTSVVKGLNISTVTGAALQLNDNALIVDYTGDSPASTIRGMLVAGCGAAAPHWTGPGIRSATAAANPALALGYAESADALHLSGAQTGVFAGQTVDATSILVRLTKAGDANLDGNVDFIDLVAVAQNYNTTGSGTWTTGDFNYDGNVDFVDLVAVAQNYGSSPAPAAPADFTAQWDQALATVPEPGSGLLLAALASAALLQRRRRASCAGSAASPR